MLYRALIGCCLVLAACARAGDGVDNPRIDAPIAIDAPKALIDAPPAVNCPGTDTCPAAMMLGEVNGDTDNQKLTAMGYQSAWFRVRVKENYHNIIFGRSLRVSAKLTSPSAVDFDVFVYINEGSDVVECTTLLGNSSTNGNVNLTRSEWGEGGGPNGEPDDRDASIEIRPVTGSCSTNQMWALEIEGNWN